MCCYHRGASYLIVEINVSARTRSKGFKGVMKGGDLREGGGSDGKSLSKVCMDDSGRIARTGLQTHGVI